MDRRLQRITCVEDDPDIRAISEIALAEIGGFDLDLCPSGADAIARTPRFRPDLILLDVMMPGMDGVETYRSLRRFPAIAATPVVFMTARTLRHEVASYRALGAAGVISKPFDPVTLADEVRAIWLQACAPGGCSQ